MHATDILVLIVVIQLERGDIAAGLMMIIIIIVIITTTIATKTSHWP
jgi:hypothetical protein